MKKSLYLFVIAICSLPLAVCPAFGTLIVEHYANPMVEGINGEHVVVNYIPEEGAGANNGGPFKATLYHADNTTDVWKTFCVEADGGLETINPGTTYKVWSTDTHAASATGNFVTDEAKWLYFQSLHDPSLLVGYVVGDVASDSTLQEAIWHGVLKSDSTPLNMPFSATAQTWFAAAAAAVTVGWDSADLVRVLNPADLGYTGSEGSQAQSMLYEIEPYTVPEPSFFMLFGTGILGLTAYGWLRRPMR